MNRFWWLSFFIVFATCLTLSIWLVNKLCKDKCRKGDGGDTGGGDTSDKTDGKAFPWLVILVILILCLIGIGFAVAKALRSSQKDHDNAFQPASPAMNRFWWLSLFIVFATCLTLSIWLVNKLCKDKCRNGDGGDTGSGDDHLERNEIQNPFIIKTELANEKSNLMAWISSIIFKSPKPPEFPDLGLLGFVIADVIKRPVVVFDKQSNLEQMFEPFELHKSKERAEPVHVYRSYQHFEPAWPKTTRK